MSCHFQAMPPNKSLQAFERVGKPRKEFGSVVQSRRPEAEGVG